MLRWGRRCDYGVAHSKRRSESLCNALLSGTSGHSIITRPGRLLGAQYSGIDTIDTAPQSSWLGLELQALMQAFTWEQYNSERIVARFVDG